jgi:hypothetical protein
MPKSFEEMALEARAQERARYGAALAAERGPMPYGTTLGEDQQDELWMKDNPQYRDPQAFLMLTLPKEAGGMGLTPLAASLEKYPERRRLYEGAGASISDHIRYAETRQKRIAEKQGARDGQPDQVGMATGASSGRANAPDSATQGRPLPDVAVGRDSRAVPAQEGGY